jgi:hypothetical protein
VRNGNGGGNREEGKCTHDHERSGDGQRTRNCSLDAPDYGSLRGLEISRNASGLARPYAAIYGWFVPHFYRSADEFVVAAKAAVAAAAPKRPVAVLVAEVDPPNDAASTRTTPESSLAAVAEIIRHTLRSDDHVGGRDGKLIMVLAGSNADDGRSVGERLCAAVRIHAFGDGLGRLTLSMGSASAPEHGNSFDVVVTAATSALQRIQSQGRDGAGAAPLHHHEALRRPLSIDRLAGRVQELASLTRWLDEAFSGQPRLVTL